MTEGANSGIKYHLVDDSVNLGLEYQILDAEGHPDINKESNHSLSSLHEMIPAENKDPKSIGEWNHARIVSKDNQVEHWLNGKKVLEFKRGSELFRNLVEKSKYPATYDGTRFGETEESPVLLQEHGDRVSFRNI